MEYSEFYLTKLYPLQDRVLDAMREREFYLTGGTALSRFYFHHRFSDDLDLFSTHEIKEFKKTIERVLHDMTLCGMACEAETVSDTYARVFIENGGISLKVDFVNEVVCRWGEVKLFDGCRCVDNEMNILANKVSAIERCEIKDLADIWIIGKKRQFSWHTVMDEVSKKSLVDPITASKYIQSAPCNELRLIKWAEDYPIDGIYEDLQRISKDILAGSDNSIYSPE